MFHDRRVHHNEVVYTMLFDIILFLTIIEIVKQYISSSKPQLLDLQVSQSGKVDEILATVRHDITAVETNLEET